MTKGNFRQMIVAGILLQISHSGLSFGYIGN